MVGPIPPATVVAGQQLRNVAPVVHQPIGAPVVANHIAPAVVANNVAKEWAREKKLWAITTGAVVGESVVGGGCTAVATVGAVLKLGQMGATTAVIGAAGAGTACVGILCIMGSILGTVACYAKSGNK